MSLRLIESCLDLSSEAGALLSVELVRGEPRVHWEAVNQGLRAEPGLRVALDQALPAQPELSALCDRRVDALEFEVRYEATTGREASVQVQLRRVESGLDGSHAVLLGAARGTAGGQGGGPASLEAVFDNLPVLIALLDADFRFTRVNRAFCHAHGKPQEHFLGRSHFELFPSRGDEALFRRVADSGKPYSEHASALDHVYNPERGATYWDWTLVPLRNDEGALELLVLQLLDVTDALSLQAELARARRLEAVGRLAGGVSHDFNNLLTVILNAAHLASSEAHGNPNVTALLEDILRAAVRASVLTKKLLTFSARRPSSSEACCPSAVVLGLDPLLRRALREQIELVTVPGGADWRVKMRATDLEQVLMNLALNASDAMAAAGGVLTLQVEQVSDGTRAGFPAGDWVALRVADTGMGIAPEVQRHLFDPYFTTKGSEGTGLGLASCEAILRSVGGSIFYETELGRGTKFTVLLPRCDEAATVCAPRVEEPARPAVAGKTALVVEDQPRILEMMAGVLSQEGFRVAMARGVAEALDHLRRSGAPDLVITDVLMRDGTGYQLLETLAQQTPSVRVLLVSGYPGEGDHAHFSGVPFLPKPFSPAELLRAVLSALQGPAIEQLLPRA